MESPCSNSFHEKDNRLVTLPADHERRITIFTCSLTVAWNLCAAALFASEENHLVTLPVDHENRNTWSHYQLTMRGESPFSPASSQLHGVSAQQHGLQEIRVLRPVDSAADDERLKGALGYLHSRHRALQLLLQPKTKKKESIK